MNTSLLQKLKNKIPFHTISNVKSTTSLPNAFLMGFKMSIVLNYNYRATVPHYEFFILYYCKEDTSWFTILEVISGKSMKYRSNIDKQCTEEVMQLSTKQKNE